LTFFKILEEATVGVYHDQSFQESLADLGGGTLKGIVTLTALLFVTLIPFFGFTELERVLGEGTLAKAFLRRSHSMNTAENQRSQMPSLGRRGAKFWGAQGLRSDTGHWRDPSLAGSERTNVGELAAPN
jgi:hypothetical protein